MEGYRNDRAKACQCSSKRESKVSDRRIASFVESLLSAVCDVAGCSYLNTTYALDGKQVLFLLYVLQESFNSKKLSGNKKLFGIHTGFNLISISSNGL